MTSKFETASYDIERKFLGPYPLDSAILETVAPAGSGIYVWYQLVNGRRLGYVGMSINLKSRLKQWAAEIDAGTVYFKRVVPMRLRSTENEWIFKAGDLNKHWSKGEKRTSG